jgi:hypothetical protein
MQVIRSVFGESEPRTGKLTLTLRASTKMQAAGLDKSVLEDVFRYGYETNHNIIVRDYTNYIMGIVIKADKGTEIDGRYMVVTCWKWDCS